jgi:hypothetical protein
MGSPNGRKYLRDGVVAGGSATVKRITLVPAVEPQRVEKGIQEYAVPFFTWRYVTPVEVFSRRA